MQQRLRKLIGSSFPFLALLYTALFGAFGTESPFFPSFLAERDLSPAEIGMVLAAGTLVRLTSGPFAGMAADLFGTKRILAISAGLAGMIILLYLAGASFWPLLFVCMLHSVAITPLNPLADALALPASVREGVFSYGWVRGVGSASFVVGTLASGVLVARFGLDSIIVSASVLFVMMVAPIPWLPQPPTASAGTVKGALLILLAIPPYRRMLVIAAMVIGSHAMSDTFAVIHWRASGIGSIAISTLLAEAVVSEIVVFIFLGPPILRRLGPARCLKIAASAGILRWAVFAMDDQRRRTSSDGTAARPNVRAAAPCLYAYHCGYRTRTPVSDGASRLRHAVSWHRVRDADAGFGLVLWGDTEHPRSGPCPLLCAAALPLTRGLTTLRSK